MAHYNSFDAAQRKKINAALLKKFVIAIIAGFLLGLLVGSIFFPGALFLIAGIGLGLGLVVGSISILMKSKRESGSWFFGMITTMYASALICGLIGALIPGIGPMVGIGLGLLFGIILSATASCLFSPKSSDNQLWKNFAEIETEFTFIEFRGESAQNEPEIYGTLFQQPPKKESQVVVDSDLTSSITPGTPQGRIV